MAFHDYDQPPWRKVPLAELTTFKPGLVCCTPSYWAITPDGCALFFRSSAQCNRNEEIVKRMYPDLEVRFIEQAFRPPQQ